MANLKSRIDRLEQRLAPDEEPVSGIFVGVFQGNLNGRSLDTIGYSTGTTYQDGIEVMRKAGESIEDLQARCTEAVTGLMGPGCVPVWMAITEEV